MARGFTDPGCVRVTYAPRNVVAGPITAPYSDATGDDSMGRGT